MFYLKDVLIRRIKNTSDNELLEAHDTALHS